MAKKGAVKKSKKEMEEEKSKRWLKIGLALLLVFIMVMVTLQAFVNQSSLHNPSDKTPSATTFSSIADALTRLPPNAQYVRYVDLNASSDITNWTMAIIGRNLPNASLFGAQPLKDVLASFPFPTMGYTVEDPQVIVLTDFGPGFDNKSYPLTTVNGAPIRIVRGVYGFSTDSYPVISGRQEYVAVIDNFIKTATRADTAYATYADLLDQVANRSIGDVKFAVVGVADSLGIGDRYYAGVTPLNNTMCDYRVVVHLNRTINETQMNDFASRWQTGGMIYGLDPQAPQFRDNYVTLVATGKAEDCLNDMMNNWGFLKG